MLSYASFIKKNYLTTSGQWLLRTAFFILILTLFNITLLTASGSVAVARADEQSCGVWTPYPSPKGRANFGMSYDSDRNVVVMYGGYAQWGGGVIAGDTWEWKDGTWTLKALAQEGPGEREYSMLAYDPVAKKTVMFGGWGPTVGLNSETWLWDGVSWAKATPAHAPMPRILSSMIYLPGNDQTRGVYLFGGDVLHDPGDNNSRYNDNDLWRWDGTDWQQITPLNAPPSARSGHSLSYFPRPGSDTIALFGGSPSDELWFFNPNNLLWEQASKTGPWPDARSRSPMVYDSVRGKLVINGGADFSYFYNDTWQYSEASGWAQVNSPGPYSRGAHSMVMTPSEILLFGGVTNGQVYDDTWKFDGFSWAKTYRPRIDAYGEVVYDSFRETNVFLGISSTTNPAIETWQGNVTSISLALQTGPESRYFHVAAYDSKRHKTVLFGGHSSPQSGSGGAIDDTWEYDGSIWESKAPVNRPQARFWSAATYDEAREVVVLYGGAASDQSPLGDIWEWDGQDWQQRFPAHSPGPLIWHAMTYDKVSGRVILNGGKSNQSGTTINASTWAWNGTDWNVINEDTTNARYGHEMVFDSKRNLIFAFGGSNKTGSNPNIAEFDGSSWTQIVKQSGQIWPAARSFFPLSYDAKRNKVALFVGDSSGVGGESTNTFWEYAIADRDNDNTADCSDPCPDDPSKVTPGICGCGVSDTDSDGDGVANCQDSCPADAQKSIPGICGCGVADIDADGDGTVNCNDQCATDPLKVTQGLCGCGAPDIDSDGDGTLDCKDSCINDPLKTNAGVCGCGVSDLDSDGDGSFDCQDSCPNDKLKLVPGTCGCGTSDSDDNGNGKADCQDPNISILSPIKPLLKQKGKIVTISTQTQSGLEYLFQYTTLTKVGKKWKEGKPKQIRTSAAELSLKSLKKKRYYNFSVQYVLSGTNSVFSQSSPVVRYKVK